MLYFAFLSIIWYNTRYLKRGIVMYYRKFIEFLKEHGIYDEDIVLYYYPLHLIEQVASIKSEDALRQFWIALAQVSW